MWSIYRAVETFESCAAAHGNDRERSPGAGRGEYARVRGRGEEKRERVVSMGVMSPS